MQIGEQDLECCFRTLILKLVNPLLLEDRTFFPAPLVLTARHQVFLFFKAAQHGLARRCMFPVRGLYWFVMS